MLARDVPDSERCRFVLSSLPSSFSSPPPPPLRRRYVGGLICPRIIAVGANFQTTVSRLESLIYRCESNSASADREIEIERVQLQLYIPRTHTRVCVYVQRCTSVARPAEISIATRALRVDRTKNTRTFCMYSSLFSSRSLSLSLSPLFSAFRQQPRFLFPAGATDLLLPGPPRVARGKMHGRRRRKQLRAARSEGQNAWRARPPPQFILQ